MNVWQSLSHFLFFFFSLGVDFSICNRVLTYPNSHRQCELGKEKVS